MEITNINYVKKLLKEGKRVSACWAQAASNITAEILADCGFDVVMMDMEHGPGDILTLISQIQALKGQPAIPFVRAPWNDFVMIKKILDAGAFGLLVPYVNTAEEAEQAVKAIRYPLDGIRGVSGSARGAHFTNNSMDYFQRSRDELFLMTAVETPEAVDNIEELVSVEGLDGLFIGPMDLSTSMGYFADPSHPEVRQAIAKVEKVVLKSNKILATVGGTWEQAAAKYDLGYQMLLLMSDTVSLSRMGQNLIQDFRERYPQR